MLNIRIDNETKEMLTYLRPHNLRFQPNLRKVIKVQLLNYCESNIRCPRHRMLLERLAKQKHSTPTGVVP